MLPIGSELFFRVPTQDNRRVLIPAKVIKHLEDSFQVSVNREQIPFEAGSEVLVYFSPGREFMQQAANLVSQGTEEIKNQSTLCAEVQLIGEPTSAESRKCYRASAVTSSLSVTFDRQMNTKLMDASQNGLSVESTSGRQIGERIEVAFQHNGKSFAGTMALQSIKELSPKRSRYGLYVVEERGNKSTLPQGLQQLSMHLQREQLKRQSGAA